MTPINKNNCESFFLDYYEKNLTPVETAEMFLFLEENSDLKHVFDDYGDFFLKQEKRNFPDKEYIKKKISSCGIDEILSSEINKTNCEEFFIASSEQLLSSEQKEKLNIFLSENPELKNIFLFYQKCKLSSEKIPFEQKIQLKKKEKPPVFIPIYFKQTVYYASAASVLILIGLFFFFRNTENNNTFIANNTATKKILVKHSSVVKEKIIPKPIISEDIDNFVTQKEETQIQEMEPRIQEAEEEKNNILVQLSSDTKIISDVENISDVEKVDVENQKEAIDSTADLHADKKNDVYITLSAFINKKIKSFLGIENANGCETDDKIGWWDLAMVVKKGAQKFIGTEKVDVKKNCDGTGEKVEYVFTVGNFEFSKSGTK